MNQDEVFKEKQDAKILVRQRKMQGITNMFPTSMMG